MQLVYLNCHKHKRKEEKMQNYIYNIKNNIVFPYDIISSSDIADLKIKYPKSKYSPFVRYYNDKMPTVDYSLLIKESKL